MLNLYLVFAPNQALKSAYTSHIQFIIQKFETFNEYACPKSNLPDIRRHFRPLKMPWRPPMRVWGSSSYALPIVNVTLFTWARARTPVLSTTCSLHPPVLSEILLSFFCNHINSQLKRWTFCQLVNRLESWTITQTTPKAHCRVVAFVCPGQFIIYLYL